MLFRYFLHNKDNAKTFRLIQKNFQLNLDEQFYMGKMNLLHIACDSGWANLARDTLNIIIITSHNYKYKLVYALCIFYQIPH